MRIIVLVSTLAACGSKETGETGHPHEHSETGTHPALLLTGDATNGATVFASTCGNCHGQDGTGGVGPSLVEHAPLHSDAELATLIDEGTGDMAAVGLEDQEIADVIVYLRETFPG